MYNFRRLCTLFHAEVGAIGSTSVDKDPIGKLELLPAVEGGLESLHKLQNHHRQWCISLRSAGLDVSARFQVNNAKLYGGNFS